MIDAWIQHPTARHSGDPIFDSLRRWTKSDLDAVPTVVAESGGRLVGVGSADISKPMEAVRDPALCEGTGLQGDSHLAVDVVSAAHRQAFLPGLCRLLRNGCAVLYPNWSYRTAIHLNWWTTSNTTAVKRCWLVVTIR